MPRCRLCAVPSISKVHWFAVRNTCAVERHHLVHVGGELRVELALQGDRHRPQHARIDVDRSRPHQQARLGIELGKKLGRRGDLCGAILRFMLSLGLLKNSPPASRVATARSVVRIPTIMSHPELWPIFRIAATASSAAPDNDRRNGAAEIRAQMAGCRGLQQAFAQRGGRSVRNCGDRTRQCRMRLRFRERVEQRERADQDIVPGRGQSRTQSDQIRDGRRRCGDRHGIRFQRAEQPGLRTAPCVDVRCAPAASRPAPPSGWQNTRPETFRRSLERHPTCNDAAEIIQLAR